MLGSPDGAALGEVDSPVPDSLGSRAGGGVAADVCGGAIEAGDGDVVNGGTPAMDVTDNEDVSYDGTCAGDGGKDVVGGGTCAVADAGGAESDSLYAVVRDGGGTGSDSAMPVP